MRTFAAGTLGMVLLALAAGLLLSWSNVATVHRSEEIGSVRLGR
ncbi:MAG: hypothetical protein AB7O57_05360 [Hyphomicrobiaceae bacterium]